MPTLISIAANELRTSLRNRSLLGLLALVGLLGLFCILTGAVHYRHVYQQRTQAGQTMRQFFLNQGAVNPHTAAHYGHIVFKPYSFLNVLDPGVEKYVGITLKLEAHKQNDAMFVPSQQHSSLIRFGELSFVLLLQVVFPLLIILMAHRAVVQERVDGTLKLLCSQGISIRQLIWGKISAYTALFVVILLFCGCTFFVLIRSIGAGVVVPDVYTRIGLLLLLYAGYYFVLIALTVYISARASLPRSVLVTLLSGWFFFTIILPKASMNVGEQFVPLPSKLEFNRNIAEENRNGINGHDPKDQRVKRVQDSLLTKYGVDSVQKLPVNVDGIVMQADEQYHNQVYDKYFSTLWHTIRQQNQVSSYTSLIDPFLAVQQLSMSLTETDVYHHFRFMQQAEAYRRGLVKKLNDEFAYGGSKSGDYDWKVQAGYWQGIDDFHYTPPSLLWSLKERKSALLALFFWVVGVIVLIEATTAKINVI
jgi:ABC-2 type transport system permease protein